MPKQTNPLRVFVDTNIFKFSIWARPVWAPRLVTVDWGGFKITEAMHEASYDYPLSRITNREQLRDASAIAVLGEVSKLGHLEFCSTSEVMIERFGLPKQDAVGGLLYGAKVNHVPKPFQYGRVVFGSGQSSRQLQLDFLSRIKHKRFLELCRATGAFQGIGKPLNRNQALDAFHVWCAEHNALDFFLTMDYKLSKALKPSTQKTSVHVVHPSDLVRILLQVRPLVTARAFLKAYMKIRRMRKKMDARRGLSHQDHFAE